MNKFQKILEKIVKNFEKGLRKLYNFFTEIFETLRQKSHENFGGK